MATYTPNWNLLKIGTDGEDIIDVESQVNRNLEIIDNLGARAVKYRTFNTSYFNLPITGNRNGEKIYNKYDDCIYIWDTSITPAAWRTVALSSGTAEIWNDVTLNSGFENAGGTSPPVGYKFITNGPASTPRRVMLRGRIRKTGLAAWTRGASNIVGSFPIPSTSRYFTVPVSSSSGARFMRFFVLATNGDGQAVYQSDTDMTAGNSGNVLDLAGIIYPL